MSEPSGDRNPVDELAEEFVARYRRGERPALTEYTRRHPELADEIRDLFPALVMMEQVRPEGTPEAATSGGQPAVAAGPVPARLGDYRLLREVGRGGMGIVYEAEQESLGRHVALKVLPANSLLDAARLERFRREAKAAARLHHTNIVPVFGVGEQDGLHYYVMQFIQGQGLDQVLEELKRLRKPSKGTAAAPAAPETGGGARNASAAEVAGALLTGRFTAALGTPPAAPGAAAGPPATLVTVPARADSSVPVRLPGQPEHSTLSDSGRSYWQGVARIGVQVAEALEQAHGQGILHRDIKPSNLLLDTHGTVWVTDFGLAKASDSDGLTQTGDIVGTLRYMAPERFQGKSDPRSDLYGLGITLYELLALRPAFAEADRNKLLGRVLHDEPPRPRKVNPEVPRDLETIVLKAIAKEPKQRYASAAVLAEDLRRFLAGKPIRARPIGAWERVVKWARRRPAAAALVAVSGLASLLLVAGLVVGLVVIADKQQQAENALAREKESREKFEQTSYRSGIASAEHEFSARNWGQGEEFLQECPPKLRGWEWHYLMRLRHLDPISLRAGKPLSMAEGFDLAFHPGNQLLAIPGCDNSIQVWNASSGRKVLDLRGDEGGAGRVRSVAFSPDGRFLASGSDDKSVEVWDTTTGKAVWTCRRGGPVKGVAFSPDGLRLASVSGGTDEPGEVNVWDAATGNLIHSFPGQAAPNPVMHAAFSPNGHWLAAGSGDNTGHSVKVWDLTTGAEVYTLPGHKDWIINVTFTPDGRRLVSTSRDRLVNVWDLPPPEPVALASRRRVLAPRWTWKQGTNSACGVALSPSGSHVAVGGPTADGNVRVYDTTTGELVHRLRGDYRIVSVAFSPDGRRLASAGYDRIVRLWDTTTGHEVLSLRDHDDIVGRVLFSPDGQRLASASADGIVKIWDASPFDERSLPHTRIIGGHEGEFYGLDFSPDGRWLATAGSDGLIELWDPQTGKVVRAFPGHDEAALCVAFSPDVSPDGLRLLSGGMDRTAKLWDARTGDQLLSLEYGFKVMVHGVAFHPNGKAFATASHQEVRLWDLTGRLLLPPLPADEELVNGVAFSPDGEYVAAVGPTATAKVWNVANGKVVSRFLGHQRGACCVAFHPKANYLASGDTDREVKLWAPDSPTGRAIHPPLSGHTESVHSVAFSRDGKYLATASWKEVIVWDANRFEQLGTFGHLAGRIWRVAFSPDGKRLAAAGGSKGKGEIEIWDATLWENKP